MELTEIEKRLETLMAHHSAADPRYRAFIDSLKRAVAIAEASGLAYEQVGAAISLHACALVSAQKISGAMRAELADVLAQDFLQTVRRAIPGCPSSLLGRGRLDG